MRVPISLRLDLEPVLNEKCTNHGPCKNKTWQMTDAGNELFRSLQRQGWLAQWTIRTPDGAFQTCEDGYYRTTAIMLYGHLDISLWRWIHHTLFRRRIFLKPQPTEIPL